MSTVEIKRNDVGVIFRDTLTHTSGVVNLSGCSVLFVMTNVSSDEVFSDTATILSASAGTVEYVTQDDDLGTAGRYRQEWQVTYGGGQIYTFPSSTNNTVFVLADQNPPDS